CVLKEQQPPARPATPGKQDAFQLLADALSRHLFEQTGQPPDGSPGFVFDEEVEIRSEPDSSHQAQRVLLETLLRIADGSDDTIRQVCMAAVEVVQLLLDEPVV